MKKIIQGAVLPFTLFASVILMLGCDVTPQNAAENQPVDTEVEGSSKNSSQDAEPSTASNNVELKSGNYFYIARDVADMQLKAGEYLGKIQDTQNNLQQAIDTKDHQQLQTAATALQQELKSLDSALTGLDLKSQEIDQIRQNILNVSQQALASPFLNGQMDFSKVDFQKIEQQMGSIQTEMLKLATMLIPNSDSDSDSAEKTNSDSSSS